MEKNTPIKFLKFKEFIEYNSKPDIDLKIIRQTDIE